MPTTTWAPEEERKHFPARLLLFLAMFSLIISRRPQYPYSNESACEPMT